MFWVMTHQTSLFAKYRQIYMVNINGLQCKDYNQSIYIYKPIVRGVFQLYQFKWSVAVQVWAIIDLYRLYVKLSLVAVAIDHGHVLAALYTVIGLLQL